VKHEIKPSSFLHDDASIPIFSTSSTHTCTQPSKWYKYQQTSPCGSIQAGSQLPAGLSASAGVESVKLLLQRVLRNEELMSLIDLPLPLNMIVLERDPLLDVGVMPRVSFPDPHQEVLV